MVNVGVEPEAGKTQVRSSPEESGDGRGVTGTEGHSARVLIIDQGSRGRSSSELAPSLESRGYQIHVVDSESQALEALVHTPPDVLILAVSQDRSAGSSRLAAELLAAARKRGVPVLDVLDPATELRPDSEPLPEADDWVFRGGHADEVSMRVTRLLRGRKPVSATALRSAAIPIDTRFTSLVVHDLRTPLNVIGLSFRMIEQALPRDDPEVAEDMRFIEENFRQMERMLSQLGDYSRLTEPGLSLSVSAFSPRRLVEELLENRETRPGGKRPPVRLDVQKTCPEEAALDQMRARVAIDYALANACAAAHDEPVRLTLRGRPQRWIIEVAIDRPPPSSVESIELQPYSYERLCGAAAERRGMDLAIAARVSELFGGTARLEAVQGQGTAIILDWPARLTTPSVRA
jgi:signal transduction histidine kinase